MPVRGGNIPKSAVVPRWAANTAYAAGQPVVNPSGDLVVAVSAFTSGSSYDATKWGLPPLQSATIAGAFRALGMAPVSNNPNGLNSSSRNVSGGAFTYRTEHWATFSSSTVRLVFGNFYWTGTGGVPNSNPILVRATLEALSGSGVGTEDQPRIPVTFDGKRHKIIDGQSIVISDPIPFRLVKGTRFYTRTSVRSDLFANAPAAPSVATSTSGGAMPTNQTYRVALSYVFPEYETVMGTSTVAPTTGAGSANKLTITAPAASGGAIGYRVWVTANGGGAASTFYLVSPVVPFSSNYDALYVPSTSAPSQNNQVGFPLGNAVLGGSTNYGIGNGEGQNTVADIVDAGLGPIISQVGTAGSYGPLIVLGAPSTGPIPPAVAQIGDSTAAGKGDEGAGGGTRGGALARALGGLGTTLALTSAWTPPASAMGFVKAGPIPGEFLSNWVDTLQASPRAALTLMCSTVVSSYGTNDLGSGAAAVKALIVKVANFYTASGIKFIQQTFYPKTTSTDGWRTAGNQTPNGDNAARVSVNQWLRDPAGFKAAVNTPSMVDVFDVCAPLEVDATGTLAPDGGRWLGNNAAAVFTGTATAVSSNSVTDSAQTWTPSGGANAGLRGYCVRILTDTTTPASVGQVLPIGYNTATGAFSLSGSWAVTPSVGATFEVYRANTWDGIHATSDGYGAASTTIDKSKLA